MKKVISSVESTVDSFIKLGTGILKLSIGLGSACVILYALKVGHFPQGLALGDGLLFLIAAACFGFVYVIFAISIGGLGTFLSPVIRPLFHGIAWVICKIIRKEKKAKYELAPFRWSSIPFAAVAILFIFLMGRNDPAAYRNLPLLSVAMYLFYSITRSAGVEYRREDRLARETVVMTEADKLAHANNADRHKTIYFGSAIFLLLLPLLVGGVTGQLADGAMRMAQVRVEKAVVYVKAPFSTLIPADLVAAGIEAPEGYKAFQGVTVLFQGFGTNTAISFADDDHTRQLDLPNDSLIVEKITR